MKRVNRFQKIKENQAKVASMASYSFAIKGITSETEKAFCFLIDHAKKGLVEKWIPKSVIVSETNDSLNIAGWFAAENMITLVDVKSL